MLDYDTKNKKRIGKIFKVQNVPFHGTMERQIPGLLDFFLKSDSFFQFAARRRKLF